MLETEGIFAEIDLQQRTEPVEDDGTVYHVFEDSRDETVIAVLDDDAAAEPEDACGTDAVFEAPDADGSTGRRHTGRTFTNPVQLVLAIFTVIGEESYDLLSLFLQRMKAMALQPLLTVGKRGAAALGELAAKAARLPGSTVADFRKIRKESVLVRESAQKFKGERRFVVPKTMWRYYTRSFKRYDRFWKNVWNVVFPVLALIVLVYVVNANKNTTYALEVNYNGTVVGYVENEQIYNEARNSAVEMLSLGGTADSDRFNSAVYSIKRVTLNKLSDASVISERLIKNSDVAYVQACGIYIDGEFLCAVKNESDAVTVFDNILSPYREKASQGDKVAFVEEIRYEQGLYADDTSVIWDAAKLEKTLGTEKASAVYYTVKSGDTFSGIAQACNITEKTLANLNPGVSKDSIYIGDTLLVSQQVRFVRVKVMKTEHRTESIPYSTVKKDSSTLYEGTTKTVQDGVNGKNRITELVTYIDGIRSYVSHISTKQISAPTDKVIYVGTKAVETYDYSSESYSYSSSSSYEESESSYSYSSSSGLSWPTRSAYSISSYYGYRSLYGYYKFHGGIDIIRSGGGSAGLAVIAAGSGTVVECGYNGSYGNTIVIDHGGGVRTRYAHMQTGSLCVSYGSYVYKGQQIGCIGSTGNSTGPHLHFEVIINGSRENPLHYVG